MKSRKNPAEFTRCRVKTSLKKTIVLALGVAAVTAVQAAPQAGASWKEGRILVKPRAGLPEAKFEEILSRHGGRAAGLLHNLDIHVVEVPVQAEVAVARALSRDPHVKFAEIDALLEKAELVPDDPEFAFAWHLSTLQVTTAWELATADGVTIAILDSGVNASHPDLSSQLVTGWNSVSDSTDTSDINGHGTLVAGTAAAATDNGTGVAAIGWNANIMPVRITNRSDGMAYSSDIVNGLTWAADNGANVANISYNAASSSAVASAAQYMRNNGGLVVMAAGNDGMDPGLSDNPAVIVVSATTSADDKASFSNYGNYVDVAAPGSKIRTTTNSGGYGSASGTSFASPATAGVIALIMGANPYLSPDEVESVLEASADDLVDGADWHAYYGHGRINAAAAVQMAVDMEGTPIDYESPAVTIFSPGENVTVSQVVPVDVNAVDNVGVTEVALYAGNELVGVDTSAPYQFSWDSTQSLDGHATLTALGYDAAGNEGSSSELTVLVANSVNGPSDETPPTVAITNPGDGSSVRRTVSIQVNGSDDVQLDNLSLYIDGTLVDSVASGSLVYDWNTRRVSDGTHVIEAVATDVSDNQASSSIQVTVGSGSGNTTGGSGSGSKGGGKKK